MPLRRYKRKSAYALSGQWRLRFYKGAAFATLAYVVLSLIKFHGQLSYLDYELAVIWAVSLLCYTSFKEVLRWNDVNDTNAYNGELWAGIVVGGALWMIIWNIVRAWAFNLPRMPLPTDYIAATAETIVLYTISVISSFLYKNKKLTKQTARQKTHVKAVHQEQKPFQKAGVQPAAAEPAQNPEVKVVLTKAEVLDDESKKENS